VQILSRLTAVGRDARQTVAAGVEAVAAGAEAAAVVPEAAARSS